MTTPATAPTFDVFISHATADDPTVDRIYDTLTAAGLNVWVDHKRLKPGDIWLPDIQKALVASKAGLLVISRATLDRLPCIGEWLFFFNKLQRKETRLFTVLLETLTTDEMPFIVNTVQYVNIASDEKAQLDRLIAAIQGKTQLPTLESKELPPEAPKSTFAEARLLKDPDDLHEAPRKLIGREADLTALENFIADDRRVVVQAHGGAGKTALAAVFAKNWLTSYPGQPALWLRAGSANADALLDAIGQAFGQSQAVTVAQGDAKIALVRQLLRTVSLLVVDDLWNAPAQAVLMKIIPNSTALLVTSRLRGDAIDEIYTLPDLQPLSALELLVYHGGAHLKTDPDAPALVELLGELAFAIEIAGRTLKRTKQTAAELIAQIKAAPHHLQALSQEERRENVATLIDASLQTLDDEARAVFMAFGAFFAPQLTAELTALYFIEIPQVTDQDIANFRLEYPQHAHHSDDTITDHLQTQIHQNLQIDNPSVNQALQRLHDNGLAEYIPATDTISPSFRIHDLSYAYAATQITLDNRYRAMIACLTYTKYYNKPGWNSFRPLVSGLDTILGAASWALTHGHWQQGKSFVYSIEGGSRILTLLGYYGQKVRLLESIVSIARQRDDHNESSKALGNLGNAYFSLGDYPRAIEYYKQVIKITQEIGDKRNEGKALGNLGNAYSILGNYPYAIQYQEQALAISRQFGDKYGEATALGNLGINYNSLGNYLLAIQYHEQALTNDRYLGDKHGEGNRLGNLGNAYQNLGDYPRALEYHEQALVIMQSIGDKVSEGMILNNLGIDYSNLAKHLRAIHYYEQALVISHQIGDKHTEGSILGNLGIAYYSLGDYLRAIQYHEQALVISQQIGDKHTEGSILGNLSNAYQSLGDYPHAIQYLEQVLKIAEEMGDKRNEGKALGNLGNAYDSLGDYSRAIQCYEQALAVFIAIGVPHLIEQVKQLIADTQAKMADSDQS